MSSDGLTHFIVGLCNNFTVDYSEITGNVITSQSVLEGCCKLEAAFHDHAYSEKETLWRIQMRIMAMAGPEHVINELDSPESAAKTLLVHACKGKFRSKVIAMIMQFKEEEQQQLMSIIKAVNLQSACRRIKFDDPPDPKAASPELERLRARIQVAEFEAKDLKKSYEMQRAQLQGELSTRAEEAHRARTVIASLQDELDIAREQLQQIPNLKSTILQLETRFNTVEQLESRLQKSYDELAAARLSISRQDSELSVLKTQCALLQSYRDTIVKQDANIHEIGAEKEMLLFNNSRLTNELAATTSDNRVLRDQLDGLQKAALAQSLRAPITSAASKPAAIDLMESEIHRLKSELILLTEQLASSTLQTQDSVLTIERLKLEEDKNAGLLSRLSAAQTKMNELNGNLATIRKENESLHELLIIESRKENEPDSVNHGTRLSQNSRSKEQSPTQSDVVKPGPARNDKATLTSPITPVDNQSAQYHQEIALMSSAVHNLVIEYQRRVFNSSRTCLSNESLPFSVSSRPRRSSTPRNPQSFITR
uniref:Uncharacterized protein n=1 Tax=Spongospora subterranea TaxID=70186 RepID=A0A0H5QVE1_9EUKA|eukprot:CRZ05958.1 hypothetical protein [Spongospora subterranea]